MRFEPRTAGSLPGPNAPEERLKGQLQPAQRLLQRVAAELGVLRILRFDLRQPVLLVVVADRLAGFALSVDTLLECRIVEAAVRSAPRP